MAFYQGEDAKNPMYKNDRPFPTAPYSKILGKTGGSPVPPLAVPAAKRPLLSASSVLRLRTPVRW